MSDSVDKYYYEKGVKGEKLGFIDEVLATDKGQKAYNAGVRDGVFAKQVAKELIKEEQKSKDSLYDYSSGDSYSSKTFSQFSIGKKILSVLFWSWMAVWEVWLFYSIYNAFVSKASPNYFMEQILLKPFFLVWSITSDPVVNAVMGVVFTILMIPVVVMWLITAIVLIVIALVITVIVTIISLLLALAKVSTGGTILAIFIGLALIGIAIYVISKDFR